MKTKRLRLISLAMVSLYGFASCGGDHDHDHAGHEHPSGEDAAHEHGDHDHDTIVAGPNGGRVLTNVEPHAELFVMEDRKVQISFLDDDFKVIPVGEQRVKLVAGDRSNPTNLGFEKVGDVLISDKVIPEGNDFPVIVQIKVSADAKSVNEKFNLNLAQCPTCENKEYACTCEH